MVRRVLTSPKLYAYLALKKKKNSPPKKSHRFFRWSGKSLQAAISTHKAIGHKGFQGATMRVLKQRMGARHLASLEKIMGYRMIHPRKHKHDWLEKLTIWIMYLP